METKTNNNQNAEPKTAKIAVIRVRGDVGLHPRVRTAFRILKLYKKNYCIIINNSPSLIGTLKTIKDHVTFGELDKETFIKLLEKKARLPGDEQLTEDYLKQKMKMDFKQFADGFFSFKTELKDVPGMKTFFRLHPPIGGFERGGIKKGFAEGGALDYRGKEINRLILRMIN